jgi:hypothetical protein
MLDFLVEPRLQEAVSRGELSNLPGEGRPLDLVNEGGEDVAARSKALRKLALLRTRIEHRYYEKAVAKLGR